MQRFRFAWAWTVGVVLAVAPAAAQTPIIEVVSGGTTLRGEIADFPPCLAGKPRLIYALDGASATDCTVGGGALEVLCSCEDAGYAAVGGGAAALGDLSDVSTAGAVLGDALVADGAGAWSPGVPSIEGAAGVAAEAQPISIGGSTYAGVDGTDCEIVEQGGGFIELNCGDGQGYHTVSDEGFDVLPRASINFLGPSITCADNDILGRTDCTVTDDDVPEAGDFGALALTGDVTSAGLATSLAADSVGLAELAACPGPAEIVEYGASGVPSCIATPSGGGIGGSTGATDNAVLRADGTGGATLQNSLPTVDDNGVLTVATNTSAARSARFKGPATGAAACAECGEVDVGGGGSGLELRLIFNWNTGHARIQNGYTSGGMDFWVGGANNVEALDLSAVGLATFANVVRLTPSASAPATCAQGSLYADSSGALCFCAATNVWSMAFPAAPTTENCT